MTEINASLIVITYNQLEYLMKLIESISKQSTGYKFETVIVDDCSNDGTGEYLDNVETEADLIIIHNNHNMGRAASRNTGAKAASGNLLIFADGDLALDDNFIDRHLGFHLEHPNRTAVGRVNYPGNTAIEKYLGNRSMFQLKRPSRIPFRYFISGNFSIPAELYNELGGFDEDYAFYGGEDLDLGYRLDEKGIDVYYIPQAVAFHVHPIELDELLSKRYEFGLKGLALFAVKHPKAAEQVPIYRLFSRPLTHFILRFITIPLFYKPLEYIAGMTGILSGRVYDYLVFGAVFKGLMDSVEDNFAGTNERAGRWIAGVSIGWMAIISILYIFDFFGERYKTALTVLKDILN